MLAAAIGPKPKRQRHAGSIAGEICVGGGPPMDASPQADSEQFPPKSMRVSGNLTAAAESVNVGRVPEDIS